MLRFILRRLFSGVVLLFVITTIAYVLLYLGGGDIARRILGHVGHPGERRTRRPHSSASTARSSSSTSTGSATPSTATSAPPGSPASRSPTAISSRARGHPVAS